MSDVQDFIRLKECQTEKFGVSGTPVAQQTTISDPAACAANTFSHSWDGATDPTAAEGAAIIADLAALKTAIDANNAAIDALIDKLQAFGLIA